MDNNQLLNQQKAPAKVEKKKKRVELIDDMQMQFRPQELNLEELSGQQKTFATDRTKDEIKADNLRIENLEKEGYNSIEERMVSRVKKKENDSELLIRDKKWYRLFDGESKEMKDVKESVAYLNNILNSDVPMIEGAQRINVPKMKKDVMSAYITAFRACDKYLRTHKLKGKHSTGERRKNKVRRMLKTLEDEQKIFEVGVDNALHLQIDYTKVRTPKNLLEVVRAEQARLAYFMTEGNSSDVYRVRVKGYDEFGGHKPGEGVEDYVRRMKHRKMMKGNLYVKKDEKLLNEDLAGFLDRRIDTLTKSKEKRAAIMNQLEKPMERYKLQKFSMNEIARIDGLCSDKKITKEEAEAQKAALAFDENNKDDLYRMYTLMKESEIRKLDDEANKLLVTYDNPSIKGEEREVVRKRLSELDEEIHQNRFEREEYRLEGRMSDGDYDLALNVLRAIKTQLDSAGDNKKAVTEKYVKLFAHDFDQFFSGLADYNNRIEKLNGDKTALANTIESMKNAYPEEDKMPIGVKRVIEAFTKAMAGDLKKMTETEWFKEHLSEFGITDTDPVYIALQACTQQDEHGLSKLFRRSMGKEVELFGQQAERSGLTDSEALATNNTASSRVAAIAGFEDVVTSSFKSLLEFKEVQKDKATMSLVTMSEEAPGEEMLSVVEEAENLRKIHGLKKSPIHYTPQAMRQLNRLQVFDTLTLQTDRHWRNFKCEVERTKDDDGNPLLLIRSLKAYDHDQSFGPKSLKQYFKDVKDPKTGEVSTKREGFLPPLMMTVDKKSTMYDYINMTKEGGKAKGKFMDMIKAPRYRTEDMIYYDENFNTDKKKRDIYEAEPFHMMLKGASFGAEAIRKNVLEQLKKDNPGKEELVTSFVDNFTALVLLMFYNADHSTYFEDKDSYVLRDGDQFIEDKKLRDETAKNLAESYEQRLVKGGYGEDFIAREKAKAFGVFSTRKEGIALFKKTFEQYRQLNTMNMESSDHIALQTTVEDLDMFAKKDKKKLIHGYHDYSLQAYFYLLKGFFSEGEENKKIIEELYKEDENAEKEKITQEIREKGIDGRQPSKEELDEAVKKAMDEKNSPTIRVPAMLHMDKKAYDSIKYMYDHWDGETLLYLIDLGWTHEKYDALKERMEEIIASKAEAEKVLNQWADDQGLPKDDLSRKFLLEEEEWEQITDVKQIALDPGNSYYSIEDSGYLCGQMEYKQFMGKAEQKSYRDKAEQERSVERVKKVGSVGDKYHSMVEGSVVNLTHEQILERIRNEQMQERREQKEALLKDESATITVDQLKFFKEKKERDIVKVGEQLKKMGPETIKDEEVLNLPYISDTDFIANYGKLNAYYCRLKKLEIEINDTFGSKKLKEGAQLLRIRARIDAMEPLMQYLKARYDVMTHKKYDAFSNDEMNDLTDGLLESRMKKEQDPERKDFYKKNLELRAMKFDVYDIKKKEEELLPQKESEFAKEEDNTYWWEK
ncbi:MAG: hypothetical protein K6G07_08320 [Lachnospiraceae bacterium]|nr:hypothetical protein [Lachnospiraceae bacterium]